MMDDKLANWLAKEIEGRNLSIRKLARKAGISHTTIADVLSQQRKPTFEFCVSIATALNEPPENLFRLAGLLPYLPPAIEEEREVIIIFRSLPADVQTIILQILRSFKIQLIPSIGDPSITYQIQEVSDDIPSLEIEIAQFLIEFPELDVIIQEAKRRGLSEPALRALMINVRIFAHNELERSDFSQIHQLLSEVFSRLVA